MGSTVRTVPGTAELHIIGCRADREKYKHGQCPWLAKHVRQKKNLLGKDCNGAIT